jgi:hypothetical protein
MEVIGAGFGRTGTRSLKEALEMLGLGPCHHMAEVFGNEEQMSHWEALADGADPDWDATFAGYRSQCDWPGASFWRELADHYPQAKVILTVRDPESWHRSMLNTILRYMTAEAAHPTERENRTTRMNYRLINQRVFDGKVEDRDHAIGVFEAHVRSVRDAVAPNRLLVLETGAGWEPLCAFLDLPVPSEPYPGRNSTQEFLARQ